MRHYRLKFTTRGPVHIGNGEKLGKNEYLSLGAGKTGILDMGKLTRRLSELAPEKIDTFCKFLIEGGSSDSGLEIWLRRQGLFDLARECTAYTVNVDLDKRCQIMACVKDADNRPYVPGSSVKGMLRTAIMADAARRNADAWACMLDGIDWHSSDFAALGKELGNVSSRLERFVFRGGNEEGSALDDFMRFVSVSDSELLETSCLVLAKKYDQSATGNPRDDNELNIFRESIRAVTSFTVNLDIDERVDEQVGELLGFGLDAWGLSRVMQACFEQYKEVFLNYFDLRDDEVDDGRCMHFNSDGSRCRNHQRPRSRYCGIHQADESSENASGGDVSSCYLGGGIGYNDKTVLAALLGDDGERAKAISRILYSQFPTRLDPTKAADPKRGRASFQDVCRAGFEPLPANGNANDHRHWQDAELGVSPHMLKMGIVGKRKYQMGLCEVRVEER